MKPEDLEFVAALARNRTGMVLRGDKAFFIENRLGSLARREGLPSVPALIQRLKSEPDEALARGVAEALTIGETAFFRDRTTFERLAEDILPDLAAARGDKGLRIWCAGCSTGQEVYSLLMLIEENQARLGGVKAEILATDLSERALEKAQSGVYTQFEVQRGLPIRLLIRYFDKIDDTWRASAGLRQLPRWAPLNLTDDLRALRGFDVILCRNVLSHFDITVRSRVMEQMAMALAPDGCLVLGADEAASFPDAFEPARGGAGLYTRNPAYARAAA